MSAGKMLHTGNFRGMRLLQIRRNIGYCKCWFAWRQLLVFGERCFPICDVFLLFVLLERCDKI